MALPKIDVPIYELTLPSNNKTIRFRPFTVKEKKLFLLVKESSTVDDVVKTLKQVIQNCIVHPTKINVDDMSVIDLELFFVHLRARSMGEMRSLDFECLNEVDGKKCGGVTKLNFNMLDAQVETPPEHSKEIKVTDSVGIMMKYPTFAMTKIMQLKPDDPNILLEIIADSVDYVYEADSMTYAKDQKRSDLIEWIEGLPQDVFERIQTFFQTAPRVVGRSKFHCQKCGYEENVTLAGLQDFFG